MPKINILDLGLKELETLFSRWSEEPFRARQVFEQIYKKSAGGFLLMNQLPLNLRQRLNNEFSLGSLEQAEDYKSADRTEKVLFKTQDKKFIEAVFIPARNRATACLSSQVGCKFGCSFCASGASGFFRNLSCGEMLEQALYLMKKSRPERLTHIVFMGMGEPLDNYDNLMKTIRVINSPHGLGIGARRITISTCGIIPGIKQLAQEGLQVELSLSLHSADEEARSEIMPINRKYPLRQLIPACRQYMGKTGRQITFEYILVKGLNSDLQNARKLSRILGGMRLSKVNLIPANPVEGAGCEPPSEAEIRLFRDCLLKSGINTTLRRRRGEGVAAACGQLRLRHEKK